jgi:hypothetical protein
MKTLKMRRVRTKNVMKKKPKKELKMGENFDPT